MRSGPGLLSDIRVITLPAWWSVPPGPCSPTTSTAPEIVIAGKLVDRAMMLHVEVTASNSKKFVVLKKDVPVEPPGRWGSIVPQSPRPRGRGQEEPNHLERLWSYLTLKELLSAWLQSFEEPERSG